MKVGCLQLNSTVGAYEANKAKLVEGYQKALAKKADLVMAPELFLSGYPARDLFNRHDFIEANGRTLEALAKEIGSVPLILGTLVPNPNRPGKPLYNSAAILWNGKIHDIINKTLLPTYDVFDEARYFEPGEGGKVFEYGGYKIGVTICEDLWNDEHFWPDRLYQRDPVLELKKQGMDLLLNVSASPWNVAKEHVRASLLARSATTHNLPVIQVNLVGGHDDLLFDGQSMAFNAKGEMIAIGNAFDEDVVIVDLADPKPIKVEWPEPEAQVFYALAMGTKDYVEKCGFKKVLLGLSGGIDSAVTAAIAVEALGPDNVMGIALPTSYNSPESLADAQALAQILEIEFKVIPIEGMYQKMLGDLKPFFGGAKPDITEENLQARIRGMALMALSNKTGRLLLTTGNKSEMAVGYCTMYGDMCGALAVISDVLKTQVYRIANWINRHAEIIPTNTIKRPPSAELRPDQTDQDSLPPYDVLDRIIEAYVVEEESVQEILASETDEKLVRHIIRLIDLNEYKRRQAPPGLKVAAKTFGLGRRRPIAQRFEV